jgi:hypothetical protein
MVPAARSHTGTTPTGTSINYPLTSSATWAASHAVTFSYDKADYLDREVWFVTGTPSGDALVRAAAEVVDDLAGQTRVYAGG